MKKLDHYIKFTFFGSRVRLKSQRSGKYIYRLCVYLIQQYKNIRYGKKEIPTLSFIAVLLLNLTDQLFTKETEMLTFENEVRLKINLIVKQADALLKKCNGKEQPKLSLIKYLQIK